MSQLTIQLSDKADALVAHLQKEIFQRRRKKVSAAAVIETLVESGARSQSDKRFATSWKNLLADIDKAARLAEQHGAKPGNLSNEEWAMVLALRSRDRDAGVQAAPRQRRNAAARKAPAAAAQAGTKATGKTAVKTASKAAGKAKPAPAKATVAKASPTKASPTKVTATKGSSTKGSATKAPATRVSATKTAAAKAASPRVSTAKVSTAKGTPRPARRARKSASAAVATTPVAQRMARAAKRLGGGAAVSGSASANGALAPAGA